MRKRKNRFAFNILTRRWGLELLQTEVAEKVGVTVGTYQTWEDGKSRPRKERLPKLAEALCCSPKDLLNDRFI